MNGFSGGIPSSARTNSAGLMLGGIRLPLAVRPSMPKALDHALRHLLRIGIFPGPSRNPAHHIPPLKTDVLESLEVISIVPLLTFATMGNANDAITGNCIKVRLPTFTMMKL